MVAISLWFCTSSIVSGNEQFRPIVLTLSCDECRRTRVTFARVRVEACDVGTRECIDASAIVMASILGPVPRISRSRIA